MGNNRYSIGARLKSFGHAFEGIFTFFKTEVNGQIHLVAAIVSIAAGFYFQIQKGDWLWLATAIAAVIVVEILNTAIEELVDLLHPEEHEKAGLVKDLAAGAVLLSAFYALIVGVAIFYKPIASLLA